MEEGTIISIQDEEPAVPTGSVKKWQCQFFYQSIQQLGPENICIWTAIGHLVVNYC